MLIFLSLSIIPIFIGIQLNRENSSQYYLSKKTTSSILGLFALMILGSHISYKIGTQGFLNSSSDFIYHSLISQMMVVPFFFYSGYGINEQFKNREEYSKGFIKNRFLRVYLTFIFTLLIGNLLFLVTSGFSNSIFNWTDLFAWENFWFVFVILLEYIFTFFGLIVFKKNKKILPLYSAIVTSLIIVALFYLEKDIYWMNTLIAFPFGIFYSSFVQQINSFLEKRKVNCYLILIISLAGFLSLSILNGFISLPIVFKILIDNAKSCFFILLILMATYIFKIGNQTLKFIGSLALILYVVQFFILEIFERNLMILNVNCYLYIFVASIISVIISIVIKYFLNWLFSKIF